VSGRIHTDSGPGVFASALAGLGIAMASEVMCGRELAAGALVPLLRDYALEPILVHAVFPGGPRPSAKVRTFVDFLARQHDPAQRGGQDR
jgi:DNA-binding transcriptional LysR family regulator